MTDFAIPPQVLQVAAEIDEVVDALRRVVERSPMWAPDSIAARQIAEEGPFSGPSSLYPLKHALLTGTVVLGMTIDHLIAIAGCLRTERTVYSPLALARPVLSSSATAFHLLDDSIDTRERLRRSWTISLAAATEQLAISRSPGDELEVATARRRTELRDLARAAGFSVQSPAWERVSAKKRQTTPPKWMIDGKPMPGEGSLIADLYRDADDAEGVTLGWTLFRATSAFVHASPSSIDLMIIEPVSHSEPGVVHARLGVELSTTATLLGCVILGVKRAADAARALFGQDDPWWTDRLLAILTRWKRIMNSRGSQQANPLLPQAGDLARGVGLLLPDTRRGA